MYKIKVYGEIVPEQGLEIIQYGYCNLEYVDSQLEKANGEDVEIDINCVGGDVDEGFAIYGRLRQYKKENNSVIVTRAAGKVSSIATIVFLAGDTRITSKYIQPFVHNAWMKIAGDSGELFRAAANLESVNDRLAKFYAEHTNLTYEEARSLMEAETFISPEEAINIRFATEIEEVLRPVALEKFKTKKSMKKDEKSILAKLKEIFASDAKNLEVFTSTSDVLVFPDLAEGDTPAVGDKATINGQAATGEITLQNGTVYVFEIGALTEIREKEEDEGDEIAALKQENAELKSKLAEQETKVNAQEQTLADVVAKQKEADKLWNKLKGTISNIKIDEKEETLKTPTTTKGGLAKAAAKLKD